MDYDYILTFGIGVKLNWFSAVARVDSDAKQMLTKDIAITFYSHFAILVVHFDF
jgi:hypothetical protein